MTACRALGSSYISSPATTLLVQNSPPLPCKMVPAVQHDSEDLDKVARILLANSDNEDVAAEPQLPAAMIVCELGCGAVFKTKSNMKRHLQNRCKLRQPDPACSGSAPDQLQLEPACSGSAPDQLRHNDTR
jgi:hypothetical protein